MTRNRCPLRVAELFCVAVAGLAILVGPAHGVTLNWTGLGADPNDFADLGNWDNTPTGGVIDTTSLVDAYVVDDAAFSMLREDPGARLNFVSGGSLTFHQGSLELSGGGAGIGLLQTPDTFGTLTISGGQVTAQFLAEINATLSGSATLTLNGGGNPVNISTIDFTSTTATLQFNSEDEIAFLTEHAYKITVGGGPALIGGNIQLAPFNVIGAEVTATSLAPLTPAAGPLNWTGGGDGFSFTNVANWDTAPTGGVIGAYNLLDDYIINDSSAFVTPADNFDHRLNGGSLTIQSGSLFMPIGFGILGTGSETVAVSGGELDTNSLSAVSANLTGGTVTATSFSNTAATLGGDATLSLSEGGNPLTGTSAIDMTSLTATLQFTDEDPAAFLAEHAGKVTVSGGLAIDGVNITVSPFGGAGSEVTVTSLDPIVTQTLNYTGLGSDPTDFTDLGNWDNTPTVGVVDLSFLIDDYIVDDPNANLQDNVQFSLESGSLTVRDGALTLTGGTAGLGLLGGQPGTVDIEGGDVAAQFIADVALSLGGDGVLTLNGGGNPVNISTIDITSDAAVLNFNAEDITDFLTEHLSKITVDGDAAVIGTDATIVEPGDNLLVGVFNGGLGSQVTAILATFLEADFDRDGDVDGDDFLAWQGGFGTLSGALKENGDYDNDGDVDGDDFLGWQAEFGSSSGASALAVPEPASIAVACSLLLILGFSSIARRISQGERS